MSLGPFRVHYTWERQHAFARLSGDHNPIHVDPLAARRTLAGNPVVHGVHLVLAGIEGFLAQAGRSPSSGTISSLSARFEKPVLVGDEITIQATPAGDDAWDTLATRGSDIVCRTKITLGQTGTPTSNNIPALTEEPIRDATFEQLAHDEGTLLVGLDAPQAAALFPAVAASVGLQGLAEILALTRLVGMRCPGLHSLFNAIDLQFRGDGPVGALSYRVIKADARFSRLSIHVESSRLSGQLVAFVRPPPAAQASLIEISRRVQPGLFKDSVALIIGGSRGLGETTAKIIAAGGGQPIITYHRGHADAERVRNEITQAGLGCTALPFDAQGDPTSLLHQLAEHPPVTSLYYFATTKIFSRRQGFFDYSLLREFSEIYLHSFGRLVDALLSRQPGSLRIFYPSSVAVDNGPEELKEYAIAKRAGEELCAFYNRHSGKAEIIIERLPRLKTDQTATLMPTDDINTLDCLLPIVQRMEARTAA